MRRALLAGAFLGAVAGLVFVHHDALRLTSVWPIVLGFALWETVGVRGSRGVMTGAAAAVGCGLGLLTFAVVAELMPITGLSLGLVSGAAVGLMVVGGVWAGARFPLAGMLIGYGAYFGLFQPLWVQSPANYRTHGVETLTIALLSLLVGILAAAVARMATDGAREFAMARQARAREKRAGDDTVTLPELMTERGDAR